MIVTMAIPYRIKISQDLNFAVFADTTASAKIIQQKFPTPMSARLYFLGRQMEPKNLFNENFVDSYPRNLSTTKFKSYTVLRCYLNDIATVRQTVRQTVLYLCLLVDVCPFVKEQLNYSFVPILRGYIERCETTLHKRK